MEFANAFQFGTQPQSQDEPMEEKTATAQTKRRRVVGPSNVGALSRRVTRLAKTLKASNPTHVYVSSLSAAFTHVDTTTSLYEIGGNIAQGDDYNQRFGSHVDVLRVRMHGTLQAGSTSTLASTVRITCFRGQSGLAGAPNMSGKS